MYNEMLIGYSFRQSPTEQGAAWIGETLIPDYWNERNREQRLLKPEVIRPLSTDYLVWPTVFDIKTQKPLEIPIDCFRQDLCDDLVSLQELIASPEYITVSGSLIAVASVNEGFRDNSPCLKNYTFLGYDVSDEWLLSGLAGILHDKMSCFEYYKEQWGKDLNNYHLFDNTATAVQFKNKISIDFPDHVPYLIYSLWLVDNRLGANIL